VVAATSRSTITQHIIKLIPINNIYHPRYILFIPAGGTATLLNSVDNLDNLWTESGLTQDASQVPPRPPYPARLHFPQPPLPPSLLTRCSGEDRWRRFPSFGLVFLPRATLTHDPAQYATTCQRK